MLPELGPDGMLPPGRYRATRDELCGRFVEGRGEHRAALWRDWEAATEMLGRCVQLNAVWMYGPFLSTVEDPQLVHCVYWAEDYEIAKARLNLEFANVLRSYSLPGHVRRILGVRVDTSLAHWHCQPDMRNRDHDFAQYAKRRGEVDDLVQRVVSGPRGAERVRQDALPRRGYAEVIINGYS